MFSPQTMLFQRPFIRFQQTIPAPNEEFSAFFRQMHSGNHCDFKSVGQLEMHRRLMIMEATKFDKQLADLVWVITTLLRGGHSLRQIFEVLAIEAPEPTASSCSQVNDDLRRGVSVDQVMSNWLQTTSSNYLDDVVATIQRQQQTGGNLAFLLEPVGEKILAMVGSDGAFYLVMQNIARQEAASLPPRIIDTD